MVGPIAAHALAQARAESLLSTGRASQLPILIVDDRPQNLRAVEAVLEPLGLPVETAGSGEEALRLLLEGDFALILLDVRMPGLDGLETARLIKARERTRDVPVVFLTAAHDEAADILRGYGLGAVDYVLKPIDPDLLRSKVRVFAELEQSRRRLRQSEAFLRGAFDSAPIGKTVHEPDHRIVRANPAFARLVGRTVEELEATLITELCHPADRTALTAALQRAASGLPSEGEDDGDLTLDFRLQTRDGRDVWVAPAISSIQQAEGPAPLILVQWVDVGPRRRSEQARAELLLEQAARGQAEARAERAEKLQQLTEALELRTISDLLPEIVRRLVRIFDADAAEIEVEDEQDDQRWRFRATGDHVEQLPPVEDRAEGRSWHGTSVMFDSDSIGEIRVAPARGQSFTARDQALLEAAAVRVALAVRRVQLNQREHWIAVELQRGLLPERLPEIDGVEVAAHYQPAGVGAEVGGDWYDVFPLSDNRLGVVLGDVRGHGIRAASTMGSLRSAARAFALGEDQPRAPGEMLTHFNSYLHKLGFDDLFTIIYACVDPAECQVTWANAGHPPPLLRSADGAVRLLEGTAGIMGIEGLVYESYAAPIAPSDSLILYTDGLIERRGESLDAGLERLAQAAQSGPVHPESLGVHILESVAGGAPCEDDVTLVIVRVTEAG